MSGSRLRIRNEFLASLVFLAIVALLPLWVTSPYWQGLLIISMYFALLAIAWNLLAGFAGQFSLAPTAFAMIGAYTTGLLAYHYGLSPLIGIPASIAVSGAIGMGLGRVVFRLRGPYLALTTLAFAEILRHVVRNAHEFTRGEFGLRVPALFEAHLSYYYAFLLLLLAVQAGLYLMLRAPAGLYLQAIRDDETAAASRGVNVVFWKTAAFAISGAICGIAGALNVHFAEIASPQIGHIFETGLVLASAVIGGMGTMIGPLIGAFLVEITSEQFRAFGLNHMLFFAFMVIVIVRMFREGLWGLVRLALGRRRAGPARKARPAEVGGS
ncbi:MAG: branched-chain amino acid ABC transporter permease [Geminicoccaceae bacterium]